ncbi:Cof subfamily protein (haloacid dehalogenase superfamily) [Evansella vedderi]|uniref:Cof subfamily protein (Haloacid dehalogenase superfamily) n=1 Tax=Evansella vedderi TaxID=38282 RepID=A0ABT9ZQU7_9BACI|nr:HAD family hydrolase [Evansella vedderi]MDQ0253106.1 Cof subfamily protein (haloacid dehalogenase superfamily) [Evansella vedderi]
MLDYKVLFLDIDGTVLRPDDTIEESTKEAIRQVRERGLDVFLATGRPLHEIREIGEELNIQSFIGYNGAYAVHRGEDVLREAMDRETIQFFLELMEKHNHEAVMYTSDKNIFTSFESPKVQEFIEKFHLKYNEEFSTKYMDEILGVTLLNLGKGDPEKYEAVGGLHLASVNLEGVREHAYDVIRDKVNKGFAVQKVLDLLGLEKENAIAFGDAMNDKEMLQLVGEGFAMGNAHPELFAYANRKTTDVTNSGVYNGLKSLGLV